MHKNEGGDATILKITGNWRKQVMILKVKFSELTDEDLRFEMGKEDELLYRVGARLKKKRWEVIKILRISKQQ